MKNQKGITLIALVVTIIVLLILAGVSIAMLTGDNGIISNSQKAKEETLKAQAKEEISLALNSIKTEVLAQVNSVSTYNPNNYADDLMSDSITGLSSPKTGPADASGAATGYYISYDATAKAIIITYVNKEANFRVEGKIKFDQASYTNGGDIVRPTV